MVTIAATAGALLGLVALMGFLIRRTRAIGGPGHLGTVSREWLHVHRVEDQ